MPENVDVMVYLGRRSRYIMGIVEGIRAMFDDTPDRGFINRPDVVAMEFPDLSFTDQKKLTEAVFCSVTRRQQLTAEQMARQRQSLAELALAQELV